VDLYYDLFDDLNSVGVGLALGIVVCMFVLAPKVNARNLSDSQRYHNGFNDGSQAAMPDTFLIYKGFT
jgi:hypothetical protein